MMFASRVLAALAVSAVGAFAVQETALSKEDEAFWGRYLEGSSSIAPSPTPAPKEDCVVTVEITCATSDGNACDAITPPPVPSEAECEENICYSIVIENIGGVCMDITVATLDLNGQIADVLSLVPTNRLCPDETASFEACGDIDLCNGGSYIATFNVEANPPNGNMCADEVTYSFTIPPPIAPPNPPPIPPPITPPITPPISPPITPPITPPISPPSPPPTPALPCLVEVDITCTTEDGTECAELVLPEVVSNETCFENVCYDITISNVGDVCMNITVADLSVNDETQSVLDAVPVNPLCPPDTTSFEICGNFDICSGGDFVAAIQVEANPPFGDMCQDQGDYTFTIEVPPTQPPNPPPSPCVIELNSECTIADGEFEGQDCSTPTLGTTLCLERPTGATMLYNGGGCEQSDNTQNLQFNCVDMNGGPPTEEGEQSYIIVTDIKGLGVTYFSGLVGVGETYSLNDNGDRFETDQFITIYTPDQSTVLQSVQYHSSCSSNLELKNRFGASQLVEFRNDLQGVVSCFQTLSFAIDVALPITATASESVELTTMTAMTSFAGTIDLTEQVAGQTIGPDSPSIVVTFEGTINAVERQLYTIAYSVEGVRVSDGEVCTGMDMISFEAGNDPNASAPASGGGGGSKSKGVAPTGPAPTPSGGIGVPTEPAPTPSGGNGVPTGPAPAPTPTPKGTSKSTGPTGQAPAPGGSGGVPTPSGGSGGTSKVNGNKRRRN